tara:strand:+ start:111 stop:332 length:222 start_codon:yes stop_codon:yes gene_type:complete
MKIKLYPAKLLKPMLAMSPEGHTLGMPRGSNVYISPQPTLACDIGPEDVQEVNDIIDSYIKLKKLVSNAKGNA